MEYATIWAHQRQLHVEVDSSHPARYDAVLEEFLGMQHAIVGHAVRKLRGAVDPLAVDGSV